MLSHRLPVGSPSDAPVRPGRGVRAPALARRRARRAGGRVRRRLPAERAVHDRARGLRPPRERRSARSTSSPGCTSRCSANGDRYFSSKGHDAPGPVRGAGRARQPRLRADPPAPAAGRAARATRTSPRRREVVTSTGSLGMGISKARGFVLADRALGRSGRVLRPHRRRRAAGGAVLGVAPADREPRPARDHRDRRPQRGPVGHVGLAGQRPRRPRGEVRARSAGRWRAATVTTCARSPGRSTRARGRRAGRRSSIAHTLKGGGVSFMEPHELPLTDTALYGYHSGAPTADEYERGVEEIRARLDGRLERLGAAPVELVEAEPPEHVPATSVRQRLVPPTARRSSSRRSASRGWSPSTPTSATTAASSTSASGIPDRFFECGIAEQDMVSQAGAMALAGLLPVVHSFACFLSTRPNEQIYNNATEGSKVIYVGSLAGIVPGGPGHSHQSVRDISALGAMPGHGADRAVLRGRGRGRRSTGPSTARPGRSTCGWSACAGRSASIRRRSTSSSPAGGRCCGRRATALRRRRAGDGLRRAGTRPTCSPPTGSRPAWSRCRGCATWTARGWPRSPATRRSSCSTTTTSPAARATPCSRRSPPTPRRRPPACTRSASRACRRAARTTRCCGPTDSMPRGSPIRCAGVSARRDVSSRRVPASAWCRGGPSRVRAPAVHPAAALLLAREGRSDPGRPAAASGPGLTIAGDHAHPLRHAAQRLRAQLRMALRLLAERSHHVELGFERQDREIRDSEHSRAALARDRRRDHVRRRSRSRERPLAPARLRARQSVSYLRYLSPRVRRRGQASRALGAGTPRVVVRPRRACPVLGSAPGRVALERAARGVERLVPRARAIDDVPARRRLRPRAGHSARRPARRSTTGSGAPKALGIPAVLAVASWDNLTNKGADVPAAGADLRLERDPAPRGGRAARARRRTRSSPSAPIPSTTGSTGGRRRAGRSSARRTGSTRRSPFLLYVCSSGFIPSDERRVVARWVEALRAAIPDLAGVGLLVRPHPKKGCDLGRAGGVGTCANVAVWPPARGRSDHDRAPRRASTTRCTTRPRSSAPTPPR